MIDSQSEVVQEMEKAQEKCAHLAMICAEKQEQLYSQMNFAKVLNERTRDLNMQFENELKDLVNKKILLELYQNVKKDQTNEEKSDLKANEVENL